MRIIITGLLFVLWGCASRQPAHTDLISEPSRDEISRKLFDNGDIVVLKAGVSDEKVRRKVVFDVFLTVETDEPDSVEKSVIDIARLYNGYTVYQSKDMISIRVPLESLKTAIHAISQLGEVVNKEIKGEDVTDNYYDMQIRLDNATSVRERYLQLLAKAEDVKAALAVEKELERLNTEIDRLKGRLNRLKHLIDYSTITVYSTKPIRPGPLGYLFYGLYKGIAWLFVWD